MVAANRPQRTVARSDAAPMGQRLGKEQEMMDLRAVAHHEAGHAVADFYHDFSVRLVTIVPDHKTAGRVELAFWPEVEADRRLAEDMLLCFACGPEAERRYLRRRNKFGAVSSDYMQGELLFRLIGIEKPDFEFLLLDELARQYVEAHWQEIRAVAQELLDRGTLTGDELRQVIHESTDAQIAEELCPHGWCEVTLD